MNDFRAVLCEAESIKKVLIPPAVRKIDIERCDIICRHTVFKHKSHREIIIMLSRRAVVAYEHTRIIRLCFLYLAVVKALDNGISRDDGFRYHTVASCRLGIYLIAVPAAAPSLLRDKMECSAAEVDIFEIGMLFLAGQHCFGVGRLLAFCRVSRFRRFRRFRCRRFFPRTRCRAVGAFCRLIHAYGGSRGRIARFRFLWIIAAGDKCKHREYHDQSQNQSNKFLHCIFLLNFLYLHFTCQNFHRQVSARLAVIKAKKHERKTKRHRDAVLLFVYVI